MREKKLAIFYLTTILISSLVIIPCINAETDTARLTNLLRVAEKAPDSGEPSEEMYSKNEIIFCTGESKAALANNKAARLMEEGDFSTAEKVLNEALKHAPLFFPFRYNIGLCYIHLSKLKLAMLNLTRAADIFPEYYKTYLQIGYIYERRQKEDMAVSYYRKALEKNRRAYRVFVLIGDIYLNRDQLEMAEKYYEAALDIKSRAPDALLGQAKIHYMRKEYYRALTIIKYIPRKDEYDKSLHYYYAECAYKLRDYKTAYTQYAKLLEFKSDKFFLTNSVSLIKHKLDLCRRFIEIE